MISLLIATRNAHKTAEFSQLLGTDFALQDLRAYPEIREVVEDGVTFAENARLKAVEVSRQISGMVLADDSGLEVDSLDGEPGVYSARYAGEKVTDEQNRRKLQSALTGLAPDTRPTARFRCALAVARKGRLLAAVEGTVEGEITEIERGDKGFGYDPLFVPRGSDRTFAELSREEKNAISHRAEAVAQLRSFLEKAPPTD